MRWFTDLIDKHTERRVRGIAHQRGRRSVISRLGVALVGGAVLPMLPFDRSAQAAEPANPTKSAKKQDPRLDDTACEYWRY